MTEYHCYFGTTSRLHKKVDVKAADDAFAIIEADRILVNTKQDAVEVWRGTRLISRTSRSRSTA
jgi:hypothetical protein